MADKFRKSTYGMMLFFPTGIDLSGWTRLRLQIKRPDNTTLTKTDNDVGVDLSDKDSAGVAAPTLQKIRYIPSSAENLFANSGLYKFVPQVEFTSKLLKGVPEVVINISEDFDT